MHAFRKTAGRFVIVVDSNIRFCSMGSVQTSRVLNDTTGKRNGCGEEERIEAREIEAFAKKRGGCEERKRAAGLCIMGNLDKDAGAFAPGR